MQVKELKKDFALQVVSLHISGISAGFIGSLGVGFVTALYESIAEDDNSFGFVAVEDNEVLGFVVFSNNLFKLYKYIALKKGAKFAFILARKIISFKVFKKVWNNICYPKKMKRMDLPNAELLSIVVARHSRGKRIAKQLIEKGFDECQKRKIDKIKVLVNADNEPANNLYLKCGFKLVSQIESHGIVGNIYVAETGKNSNN